MSYSDTEVWLAQLPALPEMCSGQDDDAESLCLSLLRWELTGQGAGCEDSSYTGRMDQEQKRYIKVENNLADPGPLGTLCKSILASGFL